MVTWWLYGWTKVDDWAEWGILAEQSGSYDVIVKHSSWMQSGKFVVEVGGESFEPEIVATGGVRVRKSPFELAFKRGNVGQTTVTIDQLGRCKVALKALAVDPKAIE